MSCTDPPRPPLISKLELLTKDRSSGWETNTDGGIAPAVPLLSAESPEAESSTATARTAKTSTSRLSPATLHPTGHHPSSESPHESTASLQSGRRGDDERDC